MTTHYRSVWISDVHLGTRDSQADLVMDFLDSLSCDHLYLVGDIIDMWALKRRWRWPGEYNRLIHRLLELAANGTRVVYIPGNHDEFFRDYCGHQFGDIEIRRRTVHEMVDGRRFLVTHGDEFDAIVLCHNWLSHLGSWAYAYLTQLNRVVNSVRRRIGMPYWSLSGFIKRRVKRAVSFINHFEDSMIGEARKLEVDGVICGHIHQPVMHHVGEITYCNTGDWVENCTALVEHQAGDLELLWWHCKVDDRCDRMPEDVFIARPEFVSTATVPTLSRCTPKDCARNEPVHTIGRCPR
ncbi:MAG: UDP-2,3-diacylglucosamine diphosphatase [Phycisphaerae bacterium]